MTDTPTAPTIRLNGARHDVAAGSSLLDLVAQLTGRELRTDGTRVDGGRLGVAAAIAGSVVPRGGWALRTLADGDEVEVVTAVQGG
ncbi:sulfur carrier protein ThiS [Microbacterium sp. Au-Mic1]|uniref:sulfur carrier protein ThiS n=1 Tax=Microbacterium sp. Au-Mic1 TaxID=2906457 RepID=UPI001E6598DE|nr:sulfur carrier protein ThiS [Microbacterium sp. Au-Mic1]MCE4027908.1 sulfur carrier protein ThiS [Microbacterium sp. Au-Mic1]